MMTVSSFTPFDAALTIALMHDALLTFEEIEAKCDATSECLDAKKCQTCGHTQQLHGKTCIACLCKGYIWNH